MPGGREIEDRKPAAAKGNPSWAIQPKTGVVRAPMHQLVAHVRDQRSRRLFAHDPRRVY